MIPVFDIITVFLLNEQQIRAIIFVSFSQISDDGMIPTDADSYDKYTSRPEVAIKVKNFTFSTSVNYAYQKIALLQLDKVCLCTIA